MSRYDGMSSDYIDRIIAEEKEEAFVAKLRHTVENDDDIDVTTVGVMLDALTSALRDDMEQGVLFSEAASAEFERKYPRFTVLFNFARRIDWRKA